MKHNFVNSGSFTNGYGKLINKCISAILFFSFHQFSGKDIEKIAKWDVAKISCDEPEVNAFH